MSDSELASGVARGGHNKGAEVRRCNRNVDQGGGLVLAKLDALLTALYVAVDDLLPARRGPGRRPRISDAELITLAIAQVFLDCPSDALSALGRGPFGTSLPLHPQAARLQQAAARAGPTDLRLHHAPGAHIALLLRSPALARLDPRPCGRSRQTVERSALRGHADYGYCAAHSRYFWGFRLYLLCSPNGMPVAFCLAPPKEPEREVAEALIERAARGKLLHGRELIIGDKGFAGEEFERFVASFGCQLSRPDRADERPRFGSLGGCRQWIESIVDTLKGQLSLERHGGRTLEGVWARVSACWRSPPGPGTNWLIGAPGRNFTADH
jgi:hypothetical protein